VRQGNSRRAALAIAVLTLGIGPWLGLPSGPQVAAWSSFATAGWGRSLVGGRVIPRADPVTSSFAAPTGCTCREITVEAKNVVRDAEVETGDATVVNRSITYVAPTYEDDDIDVDQEAVAHSGDAVAGQILAVDGGGAGCSHVRVHATNIVEDAEVTSGDATARNESVVLLDPRLNTEELDIDVDQEAEAKSGDAIAGQVIGVKGGGGPCGGVILDALNQVRHVEVETGDAVAENLSKVLACGDASCLDELRRFLVGVDSVDVCDEDGCHPVSTKKFVGLLKESFQDNKDADEFPEPSKDEAAAAPDDGPAPGDEEVDEDEPTPAPRFGPPFFRERRSRTAKATPAPEAAPGGSEAAPAPSPTSAPVA
jgi:hypothetical protein